MHETPAVALQTPISIRAIQWFDDPEDLPLTYSFASALQGASVKDAQPLGQRSIVPSTVWQRAAAGIYTIFCSVSDTFMATSRVELELTVEQAELDIGLVQRGRRLSASSVSVDKLLADMQTTVKTKTCETYVKIIQNY